MRRLSYAEASVCSDDPNYYRWEIWEEDNGSLTFIQDGCGTESLKRGDWDALAQTITALERYGGVAGGAIASLELARELKAIKERLA